MKEIKCACGVVVGVLESGSKWRKCTVVTCGTCYAKQALKTGDLNNGFFDMLKAFR